jgi:hypothetical protein
MTALQRAGAAAASRVDAAPGAQQACGTPGEETSHGADRALVTGIP